MSVIRPVAILIAIGLVVAACGGADGGNGAGAEAPAAPSAQHESDETPPADQTPTESPTMSSSPADVAVPDHLDFTSETVDGGTFDGASLAGTDAVLYFWAPWCPICRREMPTVVAAAESSGAEVSFLGVASSGGLAEMKNFVSDTESDGFPHLADENGDIWAAYGVTYQHTYAFLDDDGTYEVVTGPLSADELSDHIDRLTDG